MSRTDTIVLVADERRRASLEAALAARDAGVRVVGPGEVDGDAPVDAVVSSAESGERRDVGVWIAVPDTSDTSAAVDGALARVVVGDLDVSVPIADDDALADLVIDSLYAYTDVVAPFWRRRDRHWRMELRVLAAAMVLGVGATFAAITATAFDRGADTATGPSSCTGCASKPPEGDFGLTLNAGAASSSLDPRPADPVAGHSGGLGGGTAFGGTRPGGAARPSLTLRDSGVTATAAAPASTGGRDAPVAGGSRRSATAAPVSAPDPSIATTPSSSPFVDPIGAPTTTAPTSDAPPMTDVPPATDLTPTTDAPQPTDTTGTTSPSPDPTTTTPPPPPPPPPPDTTTTAPPDTTTTAPPDTTTTAPPDTTTTAPPDTTTSTTTGGTTPTTRKPRKR